MTEPATLSSKTAGVAPAIHAGALHRPLCLAAALTSLCGPSAAQAQSHAELVNIYARALSATTFAEQACPGFRANAPKLTLFRAQARITDAEDATVADKMSANTASISSIYVRVGQDTWCADTYGLFGPRGTLVADALAKKP